LALPQFIECSGNIAEELMGIGESCIPKFGAAPSKEAIAKLTFASPGASLRKP
jgi:hypothetical protein